MGTNSSTADDHTEPNTGGDPPEDDPQRVMVSYRVADTLSKAGFGDVKVLSHEAADRIFTEKRRELLQTIENQDVSSQRDLAKRVGRDPGAVQRDLQRLIEGDLVALEDAGRANKPALKHDAIIVEPIVVPDDLVDDQDPSYTVESEP